VCSCRLEPYAACAAAGCRRGAAGAARASGAMLRRDAERHVGTDSDANVAGSSGHGRRSAVKLKKGASEARLAAGRDAGGDVAAADA
jgi:hypothetical protein